MEPETSPENSIWRFILEQVSQNDILNLRMVNKEFKTKVDILYQNWVVRINDNCPCVELILSLRLKELTLAWWFGERPRPWITLKYPNYLQKLDVQDETLPAENLHSLLLQSKNLKSISITFHDYFLRDTFLDTLDPEIGYNFKKLNTLKINIHYNDSNTPLSVGNIYERLLSQSQMPNIRSLKVSLNDKYGMKASVYASYLVLDLFLIQHGQTLKHFTYENTIQDWNYIELSTSNRKSLLKNCSNLESLDISCCRQKSDELRDTWTSLVKTQSKLVKIELCDNANVKSDMFCAKICANNYATLTEIAINNLAINEETEKEFNMSIFGMCVNLRHLMLNMIRPLGRDDFYRSSNLYNLPKQIRTIDFSDFRISSVDFSRYLKNSPGLLTLYVDEAGMSGKDGVNLDVLKDILDHRSLQLATLDSSVNIPHPSVLTNTTDFSGAEPSLTLNYFNSMTLEKKTDSEHITRWMVNPVFWNELVGGCNDNI